MISYIFMISLQWNQECLGYLLRLLSQFAVCQSDQETGSEEVFDSYESPKKRIKKSKSVDKINIPRLNQVSECDETVSVIGCQCFTSGGVL